VVAPYGGDSRAGQTGEIREFGVKKRVPHLFSVRNMFFLEVWVLAPFDPVSGLMVPFDF
jgi:hypothetical protein